MHFRCLVSQYQGTKSSLNSFVSSGGSPFYGSLIGLSYHTLYENGTYYYSGTSGIGETCYHYLSSDLYQNEVTSQNASTDAANPYLTRLFDASARYNCHSFAWVSTNTSTNSWWIPFVSNWMSSSYRTNAGSNCSAQYGDIIVIMSGSTAVHSAVVTTAGSTQSTIYTKAKMGTGGVYWGTLSWMMSAYNGTSYQVFR